MNHERLAIPKAAADEVPPGLTNLGLQKHLGVHYYQVKLWVFHTGYQMSNKWSRRYPKTPREPGVRGRPAIPIPGVSLSDMPEGLCHYEVANRLGVPVAMAKRWAASVGYKLIDGRAKYCRHRQHSTETYRAALEAGIGKTLEEVGKELGITRERVRQLYVKLKIPRENAPHTSFKNVELVNKIKTLAIESKTIRAIANAAGVTYGTVQHIVRAHKIPFKNWIQKRHEHELATGIRICTTCRTPKPLTDYYKQHDGRLGKLESCKDCVNLKARELRGRKGTPVRPDKKAYWDRLKAERGLTLEEKTANLKAIRTSQPRVMKKQAVQQLRRHEQARNKIVINSPTAFGLTADQINKLKEGKV